MRQRVYFNITNHTAQLQLMSAPDNIDDDIKIICQPSPSSFEETVLTANAKGLMTNWALKVTQTALDRNMEEGLG